MDRELYGREAVLDDGGLAARLVGLGRQGGARVAYEHGDDPPVTVFTGGRGMGKTALLKEVRNRYKGYTPLALIDCAHVEPPADHGPGWTPVTGALSELAVQLSPKVLAARPVRFPGSRSGSSRSPRSPGRRRTTSGPGGTSSASGRSSRPSTRPAAPPGTGSARSSPSSPPPSPTPPPRSPDCSPRRPWRPSSKRSSAASSAPPRAGTAATATPAGTARPGSSSSPSTSSTRAGAAARPRTSSSARSPRTC
ncbi:hypothetical protein O1L60_16240 [Streptomyces diastatochromogenes]|nr:hypothetical protein [Streptomyces diastatochromogenes]